MQSGETAAKPSYRDEPRRVVCVESGIDPYDQRLDIRQLEDQAQQLRTEGGGIPLALALEDLSMVYAARGSGAPWQASLESALEEAAATWETAVALDHPAIPQCYTRLAAAYRLSDKIPQAIYCQEKAIAIWESLSRENRQPFFVDAHYMKRLYEDMAYFYRRGNRADLAAQAEAKIVEPERGV